MDDAMLETKLDELRKDIEAKHAQNRRDIHELRSDLQKLFLEQHNLELKLAPVFGKTAELVEKVDEMNKTLQEMRIEQASQASRRVGVWEFLGHVVPWMLALGSLLVAIWAVSHR